MQLLIGISTNLYLPAIGTAGFDLLAVNGDNLDPAPPPNITETVSLAYIAIRSGFNYFTRIGIHFYKMIQQIPNYDRCSLLFESFFSSGFYFDKQR